MNLKISEAFQVLEDAGLVRRFGNAHHVDKLILKSLQDPTYFKEKLIEEMAKDLGRKLLEQGLVRIEEFPGAEKDEMTLRMIADVLVPGKPHEARKN